MVPCSLCFLPQIFVSYADEMLDSFPLVTSLQEEFLFSPVIKFSLWPVGASVSWLLSPFSRTPGALASFLTFWYDKVFLAHLVYFLPQICNQPLLWGSSGSS